MQAKYILLFVLIAMAAILIHDHTRVNDGSATDPNNNGSADGSNAAVQTTVQPVNPNIVAKSQEA